MPVIGTTSDPAPGVKRLTVEPYDLEAGETITIRWTTGQSFVVVEHTVTVSYPGMEVWFVVEELAILSDNVIAGADGDGQWETVSSPVDFNATSLWLDYSDTAGVLEVVSTFPILQGELIQTLKPIVIESLSGEELFGIVNVTLGAIQHDLHSPHKDNAGTGYATLRPAVLFSDTSGPIIGSISATLGVVGFHAVGGGDNFGSVGLTLGVMDGALTGRPEVTVSATLGSLFCEAFGGHQQFGHRGETPARLEELRVESVASSANRSQLYRTLSPIGFVSQGGSGQFGAVAAARLGGLTTSSEASPINTGILSGGRLLGLMSGARGEQNKRTIFTTDWRWFSGASPNCLLLEHVLDFESPCSAQVAPSPISFIQELNVAVEKITGTVNIPITLNRPHIENIIVEVAILEMTENLGDVRPAVDGEDFTAVASQSATITTGNSFVNIPVAIIDNPLTTDSCWFRILLVSIDTQNACLPVNTTTFYTNVTINPPP